MIFTSLTFLVFFSVLMVLMYLFRSNRNRLYLLIIASYFFYGAWNINYLVLIFISSISGWGFGLLINQARTESQKKLYVTLSIFISLAILGYFKYAFFITENISDLFGKNWGVGKILLPVGISFFTFQTMSYTIDLYRKKIEVCRNLPKFLLFVAFFPQLVAGPIVRASEFQ